MEPSSRYPTSKESVARWLAHCYVAGEATLDALTQRASHMLGHPWRWIASLSAQYLNAMAGRTRPRHQDAVDFILSSSIFGRAWDRHQERLRTLHCAHYVFDQQRMQPVQAFAGCLLPRIESARELADWFWLEDTQLAWYADLLGLTTRPHEKLRHYYYRIIQKPHGGIRLIEAPKRRLKEMQRQILDYLLEPIRTHPAVHGFVKGRSIQTFASPHVGKAVVVKLDLKSFFPAFRCARVQALFRTLGYPEMVADLLGGICTTTTPQEVVRRTGQFDYSRRHLPQGSPSSPALANLCSYRMDCRLAGLAKAAGAQYTRYADDLAFSGDLDFARRAERFAISAAAILLEEGFEVQHHKTRIMRQGVQQHLAGLVVNNHLNVDGHDFDVLKATLTNCVRHGPAGQNLQGHSAFREHLEGRVSFVESVNAARGARLRRIFDRIEWQHPTTLL